MSTVAIISLLTVQCVYETIDQPCNNCAKRNVPCGAADKTYGNRREFLIKSASGSSADMQLVHIGKKPSIDSDDVDMIFRLPSADGENPFSSFDLSYVDYFRQILFPEYIEEEKRTDGRRLSDCIVTRFGTHLNSNAFRYAVLLYAYCFKELEALDKTKVWQYYATYLEYTKDAIARGAYAEAIYACHTVCMAGFVSGLLQFEEISCHAGGFLGNFETLVLLGQLPVDEIFLFRCMCKDIFCWLTGTVGSQREVHAKRSPARAAKLFELVQRTGPLFQTDDRFMREAPEWMRKEQGYLQVQMLMYRLQITFDYYHVKQKRNEDSSLASLETLTTTIKTAASELFELMKHQPQLRSQIGDSQFFPFHQQSEFGPSVASKDSEYMKWKPSILATYKSKFEALMSFDSDPERAARIDVDAVGNGMSICRIIDFDQNKSSLFEMNSMTALRSLFITGVLLTERDSPEGCASVSCFPANAIEGTSLRAELNKFFNLDDYLRIRMTQSPLLKSSHRLYEPANEIQALKEDLGGIFDCRGRLRDDKSVLCPSCGRLTCDALDIFELNGR